MFRDVNAHVYRQGRRAGTLAALTAALMLGACSQTSDLLAPIGLADVGSDSAESQEFGGTDLQKATTYWGQEYSKQPTKLENALNYARNLKALGEKQKALTVLQQASLFHDGNKELAGEYGRVALELNQVSLANRLLTIADDPAKPDWKVVSARGTVAAKQGDYKTAIAFYERAQTLSANQPSVINNLAMAHAMSGEARKAEDLLRRATTVEGAPQKVRENLALVLGLQGRYDEAKTAVAMTGGAAGTSETIKSDTDLLRSVVKAPARPASDFIPAFSTSVASAPTPAPLAAPSLRPAVADKAASEPAWQTTIAASAPAAGR